MSVSIVRVEKADGSRLSRPQAAKVLDTGRFILSTGRRCLVTPASQPVGNGERHIVFTFEWEGSPSPEENQAVMDYIQKLVGKPVEFEFNAGGRIQEAERLRDEYLNPGRRH